jgi:hypothetical protein
MLNYLFLKQVPISIVMTLLEKVCAKTNSFYLIDSNAYRKMIFFKLDAEFKEILLPYYHISKRYYITRDFSYNSFTNIIRQICKSNGHHFYTEIKYDHSVYTILYFISILNDIDINIDPSMNFII